MTDMLQRVEPHSCIGKLSEGERGDKFMTQIYFFFFLRGGKKKEGTMTIRMKAMD